MKNQITPSMKAAIHTKYGPPSVLQIKEVEKPSIEEDELLIKVEAATVNRTDCAMLRAKPFIMRFVTGFFKPKKPILGTDFAGIIVEIGDNVQSYQVGDRVFGFDDLGVCSHAQFMKISEKNSIAIIPPNASFKEATASIEGAHYAHNFMNKIQIEKGDKVLVNGASGAIGSAAVQLLHYHGAEVTAVCNTKNIELIKTLGATRTIDYLNEDFTSTDEKYEFVFDTVGKSSFAKCKTILQPGGIYISSELGWMAENLFFALYTPIKSRLFGSKTVKKVVFPIPLDKQASVNIVKKLVENGGFKSVIDREYRLNEIADAFIYVETGQKTGNVVIAMDREG